MEHTPYWRLNTISILECEVDDMTGEMLGQFMEQALAAGALDLSYTPVQMKKNRPGIRLTLICKEAGTNSFIDLLFRHTTTLGIRVRRSERAELDRRIVERPGPLGAYRVKQGLGADGEVLTESPEYEDLRRISERTGLPLKSVLRPGQSEASVTEADNRAGSGDSTAPGKEKNGE